MKTYPSGMPSARDAQSPFCNLPAFRPDADRYRYHVCQYYTILFLFLHGKSPEITETSNSSALRYSASKIALYAILRVVRGQKCRVYSEGSYFCLFRRDLLFWKHFMCIRRNYEPRGWIGIFSDRIKSSSCCIILKIRGSGVCLLPTDQQWFL